MKKLMPKQIRWQVCGAALAAVIASMATADLTSEIRDCRYMVDVAARLQCYDGLADALGETPLEIRSSPESSAETDAPMASTNGVGVDVVSPDTVSQTKPATGSVPSQPTEVRSADQPSQAVDDGIESDIVQVDKSPLGKLILTLANGQVWQQLDSKRSTLKIGDRVEINSAISGSFLLRKITGGTSIRVKHVSG